jgi:hypothetical protein
MILTILVWFFSFLLQIWVFVNVCQQDQIRFHTRFFALPTMHYYATAVLTSHKLIVFELTDLLHHHTQQTPVPPASSSSPPSSLSLSLSTRILVLQLPTQQSLVMSLIMSQMIKSLTYTTESVNLLHCKRLLLTPMQKFWPKDHLFPL